MASAKDSQQNLEIPANSVRPETLEEWAARVMSDGFSNNCFKARGSLVCNCGLLRKEKTRIEKEFDMLPEKEKSKKTVDYREQFRQAAIREMNEHEKCTKALMESSAKMLAKKVRIPPVYSKYTPQNPKICANPNTTPEQQLSHHIENLYLCSGDRNFADDREVTDVEVHDNEERVGNFTRSNIGTERYFQMEEQRWFFGDDQRFNNANQVREMIPQFEARVCRVSIAVWILKQWQKEKWFANFTDEMKKECDRFVVGGTLVVTNELRRIAAAELQLKKLTNPA
jgi:hypothetical protein